MSLAVLAFQFVKGRSVRVVRSFVRAPLGRPCLVSSHTRAPRHLHRLVCECLSATKGERGRGLTRSSRGPVPCGIDPIKCSIKCSRIAERHLSVRLCLDRVARPNRPLLSDSFAVHPSTHCDFGSSVS